MPSRVCPSFSISALVLWSVFALPLMAQKAEATKIEFAKGSSSTMVTGILRGQQQMEYAVGAKRKQVLYLQLYAVPVRSLTLQLRDGATYQPMALTASSPMRWSAVLPQDGDYEIWVVRENGHSAASTYKLRVAIR